MKKLCVLKDRDKVINKDVDEKQNISKNKILYIVIFVLYAAINLFLVLRHEPWRDEVHTWLLSKNLSIPELIVESRFDGHPILWHLILMPFAKLNFPIITLNIVSYVLMLIATFIFLFKTDLNFIFKIIVIFTIPFTYIYSAMSRNYGLIVLFLVIIGSMYDKRYDKPILYSIMIALLVHTHALAWGLVAGLTITFHFDEILLFFKKKNKVDIKKIIIGLAIIAISTILVVLELFGTSNSDYRVDGEIYTLYVSMVIIITAVIASIICLSNKTNYRELIILWLGFEFQVLVYTCVYSIIIIQRYMLIFVFYLFYIILLSKAKLKKELLIIVMIEYIVCTVMFGAVMFVAGVEEDVKYKYSSAQEMADYINKNLPENTTILIDASIIGQTMIPYLDSAELYDIVYKNISTCAAHASYEPEKILKELKKLDSYSDQYIIICNNFVELDYEVVYQTDWALKNEVYTLYYIP